MPENLRKHYEEQKKKLEDTVQKADIGRFGMGFKSVFKYTYQPEIYSDDEAFKITRYLLQVEVTGGWDYEAEKKSIVCKLGDNRSFLPFLNEKHLTKIVIPFKKYGKNGELVAVINRTTDYLVSLIKEILTYNKNRLFDALDLKDISLMHSFHYQISLPTGSPRSLAA